MEVLLNKIMEFMVLLPVAIPLVAISAFLELFYYILKTLSFVVKEIVMLKKKEFDNPLSQSSFVLSGNESCRVTRHKTIMAERTKRSC